jgi:hypothetical protein
MDPFAPKLVCRERVTHGRVVYHVQVFAVADGYRGKWSCTACGQNGQSAVNAAGEAAALCWAKDGLAVHHAAAHANEAESRWKLEAQ